jgi:hypothetical protein
MTEARLWGVLRSAIALVDNARIIGRNGREQHWDLRTGTMLALATRCDQLREALAAHDLELQECME